MNKEQKQDLQFGTIFTQITESRKCFLYTINELRNVYLI